MFIFTRQDVPDLFQSDSSFLIRINLHVDFMYFCTTLSFHQKGMRGIQGIGQTEMEREVSSNKELVSKGAGQPASN